MTAKGKLGDFDPFKDATTPTSPGLQNAAETPAEANAGAGTGRTAQKRQRAAEGSREGTATVPSAQMSRKMRAEWRHRLRSAAGGLAAARDREREAEELWTHVVEEARAAGVEEESVQAAGLEVGLPTPPAD